MVTSGKYSRYCDRIHFGDSVTAQVELEMVHFGDSITAQVELEIIPVLEWHDVYLGKKKPLETRGAEQPEEKRVDDYDSLLRLLLSTF